MALRVQAAKSGILDAQVESVHFEGQAMQEYGSPKALSISQDCLNM